MRLINLVVLFVYSLIVDRSSRFSTPIDQGQNLAWMYNHGHFTYVSPRSKMSSKAVRTPDDISRDVRGMKLRQRVSATLDDDLLREDLEEIILERVHLSAEQIQLRAYKDIAVLTGNGVKAISDIRGSDTLSYSKADRVARCKLAAVYRLLQLFGWGEGVFDHTMCTVRTVIMIQNGAPIAPTPPTSMSGCPEFDRRPI